MFWHPRTILFVKQKSKWKILRVNLPLQLFSFRFRLWWQKWKLCSYGKSLNLEINQYSWRFLEFSDHKTSVVEKTTGLSRGGPCFKIGGPSMGVLQFWKKDALDPIGRQTDRSIFIGLLAQMSPEKSGLVLPSAVRASEILRWSAPRYCKSSELFNSSDHLRLPRAGIWSDNSRSLDTT